MVGVPAVWELIRKGIVAKVEKTGKLGLFNKALGIKQFATTRKIPGLAGLTDKVVFNAVKAQTGGRLKIALTGGGSLSASTQEFISNAVVPLIQGKCERRLAMFTMSRVNPIADQILHLTLQDTA